MNHLKKFDEFQPLSENVMSVPSWWDKAKEVVGDVVGKAKEIGGKIADKADDISDKGMDKFDNITGRSHSLDKKGLMFGSLIDRHMEEDAELFKSKVIEVASRLKINPNWLLVVIEKESSFNPRAKNPNGSASGLLQMIDSSARGVGTTSAALRQMKGSQQLDYIYKYFKGYTGKMNCVEDVYMITFRPSYFKHRNDPNKVVASGRTARINSVVDLNKDGEIKMSEFKAYVRQGLPADINKKFA